MVRLLPGSALTYTLSPYTTLFRSPSSAAAWTAKAGRSNRPPASSIMEPLFEQFQDAFILVGPAAGLHKSVVFYGIDGQLPLVLAELDEGLAESHDILEMHIDIDDAVAHEQVALEALGKIDRRRPAVRYRVCGRFIEAVRGVAMVVMRDRKSVGEGKEV